MREKDTYTSETIEDFLNFIYAANEAYQEAYIILQESDKEMTDLEHYIELTDCAAPMMSKIYMRMKKVRRKRRDAKETIELYKPITEWINNNKTPLKELGKRGVLSQIKLIEAHQSSRFYTLKSNILDDIVQEKTL